MSDRYPGGFIKAVPPVTPSEYSAPGIWTLEQAAVYKKAGQWPVTSDPYFKDTTLLLHGDGSGQELCFADYSSNDFPITVNGDAYGSPFSPYSLADGEWSNFFANTNTQYLTLSNSGLSISSGQDFTIEFWYNLTTINSYNCAFSSYQGSADGLTCYVRDGTIIFYYAGDSNISGSATSVVGQWHHLAISGTSGSSIKMFHDGVQIGTTSSATISNNGTGTNFAIGRFIWGGSAYEFPGYISNFSINVGTAKYTSNFTPSTTPLAVDATNQKLLTCYSNRFIDANTATTAKTITVNGTPAVKANSPFTTTIDGTTGSGYFDGSGDTISTPDNAAFDLGSSDFCIEFWFYPTTFPTYANILNKSNSQATYASYQIWMQSSGTMYFYASSNGSSYDLFSGAIFGTVKLNQFNHIAVYRNGSNWYGAVNGSVVAFTPNSGTLYNNSHPLVIGGNLDAHNAFGFISNVRIVKGDPIYGASNFTPPTATLTNVTGTSLLTCQYQNAVRNVGFIDSSPNNFLITRNGNTTQGSFSPFSADEGKWSNFLGGSANGNWVRAPSDAAFGYGTGDFTIQCWIYLTSNVAYFIADQRTSNAFYILGNSESTTGFSTNAMTTRGSTPLNEWAHFALCRASGTLRLFVNGVLQGSSVADSTNYATSNITVGASYGGNNSIPGYISNFEVIKEALYTADFTPPVAPLTATANTSLLTCQSNRFVDNSSNGFALTSGGSISVQPFSPFAPSAAYSTSVNGGSGYFDGTTDYLSLATNAPFSFGTNDFTIEWWQNTTDTEYGVIHTGSGGWGIVITGGTLYFQSVIDSTNLLSASLTNYLKNQWVHFALVRNSGTLYLYINGVQITSAAYSTNISLTPTTSYVGYYISSSRYLLGYFAGLRVVNGTAVYTSAFTPPTTPPTAIANTSLLLNFTNAGIFDSTAKNDLETVGNAQVDTSVVKWGAGSMKFDWTDDRLVIPASPNIAFGTGDFTIEAWVNPSNVGTYGLGWLQISGTTGGLSTTYTGGVAIYFGNPGAGAVRVLINGTGFATNAGVVSAGTYHHFALTRQSGTCTIWINGVSSATTTNTTDLTAQNVCIGGYYSTSYLYDGYLDDLRITKGVARYTANFTPPGGPFLNK